MRRLTTSRNLLLRLGLMGVGLGVLVGCGASSAAATLEFHSAGARVAHSSDVAHDRVIARDALLRRSDFPAGWTQTGKPTATGRSHCRGADGARAAATARVVSPEFTHGTGSAETVDSAVYIAATPAAARHSFALLSSRGTLACLGRLARQNAVASAGPGVHIGPVKITSLTIAPIGDQFAASRLTIRVSASGVSLPADADVIFVRSSRGIELFTLAGLGSPFDPALEAELVRRAVGRLAGGLGPAS